MADLIERQQVINALNMQAEEMSHWSERYQEQRRGILTAVNIIVDCPSAQPERKKGYWVFIHPLQKNDNGAYICSECKVGNWEIDPKSYFFCPNCGTDMRGEENEIN